MQASDGHFYGTTGSGSAFRYRLFPDAPGGLTVRRTPEGANLLAWTGAARAASYRITRQSSSGEMMVLADGLTMTTFLDSTISPDETYSYAVSAVNANGASAVSRLVVRWRVAFSRTPGVTTLGDYDGDGQADLAVFRGTTGEWLIRRSSDGGLTTTAWGAPLLGDVPVVGDYDGDGRADLAVFRQSTGEWFIRYSSDQTTIRFPWGSPSSGDIVRPF